MHATRQSRTPVGGKNRTGQLVALLLLIGAMVAGAINITGHAQESTTLVTIGESNNDEQRAEILGYFGNPKNAKVEVITVQDTKDAMEDIVPDLSISLANSSAALSCLPLGEGLQVETFNITGVTPSIYAIALVTAGVGDASLIVAAPFSASAGGMTALTGIFDSWEKVSCESSQATPARQELALRELALTVEISSAVGQAISGPAGFFVIEVQRNIVVGNFKSQDDIAAVVANQEAAFGFTLPAAQRDKLIDLMVDLMAQDIDWSTFAKGWEIAFPSPTRIEMTGDGIAIQNAQASATARAAEEMTATARAERESKRATQTAVAAQKTAEAAAAMTQTAEAQPTATATATPMPSDVAGELVSEIEGAQLTIRDDNDVETKYTLDVSVRVTRDGNAAAPEDLKVGDSLALKVDVVTGEVVDIVATAPPSSGTPVAKLLYLLPILLLIPLGMVLKGRSYGDPFVVKRVVRD